MYLLGYNFSVAVGVGFIALAGVAVEIGVIMLVYLNQAHRQMLEQCQQKGVEPRLETVRHAVLQGAGAVADHVRDGYRFRSHEPNRSADGRRDAERGHSDLVGTAWNLPAVEARSLKR